MSNQAKHDPERQISTLPPILRKEREGKEMQIFRVKSQDVESYELICGGDKIHSFNQWQYHALCALFSFGGDDYDKLLVNVNDRFGSRLSQADLKKFFVEIADKHLFSEKESEKHPLIKSVLGGREGAGGGAQKYFEAPKEEHSSSENRKIKHLFNPTNFLKRTVFISRLAKLSVYPLPFLVFAALLILSRHFPEAAHDIAAVKSNINIVTGLIISLLTINTLVTFATASVVYYYGGTVTSVAVARFYGFVPRFVAIYEDIEKFSRSQKLWFRAAPLLARLAIFSISVLLWYQGRTLQGALPQFFSTIALLSGLSFLITACPFYKGSGYNLLAEFMGEPDIRKKAFRVLLNKYRKNAYVQVDSDILAGYALACIFFSLALAAAFILLLHHFLSFEIGTRSLAVILVLTLFMGARLRAKIKNINEAYEQKQQFERWRKRVLPKDVSKTEMEGGGKTKKKDIGYFGRRLLLVTILLALFCPYPYRASGRVTLMPAAQQQISTDIAGIIDEVFFDGGESLKADTVIARLSVKDQQAQLEIAQGKLAEQKAYIEQLKTPAKEDIAVAQERLDSARVQWNYSSAQCGRQKILYDSGAIALDALQADQKICEGDRQKVLEAEAELARVQAGPTPEEITTAETALQTIEAQITLYQDQIERSTFKMPFDGTLAALNLKEKKGDFLERGSPLAMAENDSAFRIVLELPETDAPYIRIGAAVDIRLSAHPGKVFAGTVTAIDSNIEDRPYGKTVRMIATLENEENELKSGMTGYAKAEGESLMLWQVLTRAVYRFITVEMWAWVP